MELNETLVRERAYMIWEREGRLAGLADQYWLQAQAELAADTAPVAKPVKAKAKAAPKAAAKAPARAKKAPRATDGVAFH